MLLLAALMAAAPLSPGQMHYSESCGGCHGLLGVSARGDVPTLRDRVGMFLCSKEGRDYVVRLPNVAFAAMDDENLVTTLNFMMFGLGGSRATEFPPFTLAEIRNGRAHPLKASALTSIRESALAKADAACLARTRS